MYSNDFFAIEEDSLGSLTLLPTSNNGSVVNTNRIAAAGKFELTAERRVRVGFERIAISL